MNNAEKLAEYAEKNPIVIYGDYRDELPDDIIDAILSGENDKASELMSDCESNMYCYDSHNYEDEALKEACKALELEYDYLTDDEREAFNECIYRDYSDFWNTCFKNSSRVKIAVTLLDDNGETIDGPHYEWDDEENERIKAYLLETLGDDCSAAELCYSSEVLKIGGCFDLKTLYEKGLPNKIRISANDCDNLLFHGSMNGSGSLGSIKPTKEHVFKCVLRNDNTHKYGLDAVYGFCGSWWQHELDFIFDD